MVHLVAAQLAAVKRGEIEELLGRLSDVNEEMGGAVSGAGDSRAHTLTRHREIMVELTQVGPAANSSA
jgi:Golgi SNAP receptor complex protein 1